MKNKQIVFITNPFGFGPAGKLYPIMKEFHDRFNYELIFFTGSLTNQIINSDFLKIIQVDERSEISIEKELTKLTNPYVISSLNKFAVRVCHKSHIPCIFIDGLTWLWNEIPSDYLLADKYYSLNFLGVDAKLKGHTNIVKVPYILDIEDLATTSVKRKDFTLVHIGGFQNPLHNSNEQYYLQLIIEFFNNTDYKKEIVIAGGKDAISFLEKNTKKDNILFKTLEKKDFNTLLKSCKHLITTPGLTTTMESFISKTPVSFLLPSNLSQYKILSLLIQHKLNKSSINWDEFYPIKKDLWDLNENDALIYLDNIAKKIIGNSTKINSFNNKLEKLLKDQPNTTKQHNFISKLGANGAKVIVDDLTNLWSL